MQLPNKDIVIANDLLVTRPMAGCRLGLGVASYFDVPCSAKKEHALSDEVWQSSSFVSLDMPVARQKKCQRVQ